MSNDMLVLGSLRCKNLKRISMRKRLLQTSVSIGILLQYLRSGWVSRQVVTRQSSSLRQSLLPSWTIRKWFPSISKSPLVSPVGLADITSTPSNSFMFCVFVKGFLLECGDTKMVFEVPRWVVVHHNPMCGCVLMDILVGRYSGSC